MGKVVIPGFRKIEVSGGGEGGTTNYNDLTNKPSINNVPLVGNLRTVDLKLTDPTLTEEGVPAEAKTVGTKLEEHSTSLTELSEQLGNHTVKSDVPENAVFTDTVYDDTEVKGSIDELNSNLMDLKMLGWSVSSECPIQNYVDSDGVFHQIVGRVDLSNLNWVNESYAPSHFYAQFTSIKNFTEIEKANIFCAKYTATSASDASNQSLNKVIVSSNQYIAVDDNSYTDATIFKNAMQGVYLYYELDTPITKTIDGNEVTERINESLAVIGKCKNLLNPTFKTATQNGITCTKNGDGTYTLNGTATNSVFFFIQEITDLAKKTTNKDYKLVGCPSGGIDNYDLRYEINSKASNGGGKDFGDGVIIKNDKINSTDITSANVIIAVTSGKTVNNLVFKPMLTANLNATYDDFVPYTGDGETLTHDVAELKNDLSNFTGDIDAKTVNGHTVESNVPANAKFTDTIYDDTSIQNKLTTHTHDDRYYTETEVNNLLNGKANSSHSHGAYELPVGSIFLSSRKVAPSYGNWEYLGTIQNLFSDLPLIQSIGEGYVYNRTS